jgi:hypothetical protein
VMNVEITGLDLRAAGGVAVVPAAADVPVWLAPAWTSTVAPLPSLRLLRIELRRTAMPWILPLVAALSMQLVWAWALPTQQQSAQASRPGAASGPVYAAARPAIAGARLARLYLQSRRAPAALGLLAGLGTLLWVALHWHWDIAGGPAYQQLIPLTIETGAAAVIAVSSYGSFGEPERATGRWLPWLRLGAALLMTVAAFGALAAGATGATLPGGSLALLRNLAGMTGTGLLSATALGGVFGWAGPMAYLLLTQNALTAGLTTPWIWPTRPPHDPGAAICAGLVIAAGLVLITVRGARESGRRSASE